jgi:hypothetical protein
MSSIKFKMHLAFSVSLTTRVPLVFYANQDQADAACLGSNQH